MAEAKTKPTKQSVDSFIKKIHKDIATPLLSKPAPKKPGRSTPSIVPKLISLLYRRPFFQRLTQLVEEEYDAEKSKKNFELSRPPKGVGLELISIRLMELFQIEDLGKLQRGIIDLFPGIKHDLNARFTVQSLLKEAGDIFLTNAHWNVGYVARTKLFMGLPFRRMTNLPDEISHVDVGVVKFTASSFVLCLDVYMTDEATQRLMEGFREADYPRNTAGQSLSSTHNLACQPREVILTVLQRVLLQPTSVSKRVFAARDRSIHLYWRPR